MDATNDHDGVNIVLSDKEAVVFFDWLSRFNQQSESAFFEDQAEERVLWNLEAAMEKKMSTLLASNYKELLYEARKAVRD